MGAIDLSKFTFVGDTIKGMGELTFEKMLASRNALDFLTTYGNIKVDTEVGFVGDGGLVGRADQGCDPVAQDFSAATRVVKWQPADWEVLLHLCYKDLDGTIAEYSRKNGVRKPDLTATDYEAILETILARSLNKFLWRLMWFNDKDAANVSAGGVITNGVAVSYFNIIDGLWKQIFAQVSANPAQHLAIAGNAGATYAQQTISAQDAHDLLYKMTTAAPMVLRQQSDKFILATQNLVDKYVESLSDAARVALESVQSNFIEGMTAIKVNGWEVIAMPEWDEHIAAYEDNGASLNKPFRALATCKSVLGAGFDVEGDFSKIDAWYDKDSRKVKVEAMGNGDAKLLDPSLFVAAY